MHFCILAVKDESLLFHPNSVNKLLKFSLVSLFASIHSRYCKKTEKKEKLACILYSDTLYTQAKEYLYRFLTFSYLPILMVELYSGFDYVFF